MEASYADLATFEKKLFHDENVQELHYKFLNVMLLITHNGFFYCFCDKFHGCELNYNQEQRHCPLCWIPTYLTNFEEEINRSQFEVHLLKIFGLKLTPLWRSVTALTNGPWNRSVDNSIILPRAVILGNKMKHC